MIYFCFTNLNVCVYYFLIIVIVINIVFMIVVDIR